MQCLWLRRVYHKKTFQERPRHIPFAQDAAAASCAQPPRNLLGRPVGHDEMLDTEPHDTLYKAKRETSLLSCQLDRAI